MSIGSCTIEEGIARDQKADKPGGNCNLACLSMLIYCLQLVVLVFCVMCRRTSDLLMV
jgi:hypothetical protein